MNLTGLPELLHSHIGLKLNVRNPDWKRQIDLPPVKEPADSDNYKFKGAREENSNLHLNIQFLLENRNYIAPVFQFHKILKLADAENVPHMQKLVTRAILPTFTAIGTRIPLGNPIDYSQDRDIVANEIGENVQRSVEKAVRKITLSINDSVGTGRDFYMHQAYETPITHEQHVEHIKAVHNKAKVEPQTMISEPLEIMVPPGWFGTRSTGWKHAQGRDLERRLECIRSFENSLKTHAFDDYGFANQQETAWFDVKFSLLCEYEAPKRMSKVYRASEFERFGMDRGGSIYSNPRMKKKADVARDFLAEFAGPREFKAVYLDPRNHNPKLCDICNPQLSAEWRKLALDTIVDGVMEEYSQ